MMDKNYTRNYIIENTTFIYNPEKCPFCGDKMPDLKKGDTFFEKFNKEGKRVLCCKKCYKSET